VPKGAGSFSFSVPPPHKRHNINIVNLPKPSRGIRKLSREPRSNGGEGYQAPPGPARLAQRKPIWLVVESTAWPWRAAGR
jgi:hypothetical protein